MSATNRGAKRRERDAYSTPYWCTEAIMGQLVIPEGSSVLEPCVGKEAIWEVLSRFFHEADMDWFEIERGQDFLNGLHGNTRYDFIITNPPFSLAQEFVDKSLSLANCVIMLLPQSFFGSQGRKEWWQKHPPTAQFILSRRPSFTGDGRTDSEVYSWVVWDSTGRQKHGWYWI